MDGYTSYTLDGIDICQFVCGPRIAELHQERYEALPTESGVYLVVRDTSEAPSFVEKSGAGWFKRQDPSYPIATVVANWVADARVVYIGKAAGKRGLRQRIGQLIDFGFGRAVGHRGGRALWHLQDHATLRLRWMVCDKGDARALESWRLQQFRDHHGMLPFANMTT